MRAGPGSGERNIGRKLCESMTQAGRGSYAAACVVTAFAGRDQAAAFIRIAPMKSRLPSGTPLERRMS
jgi:hypothetical protein